MRILKGLFSGQSIFFILVFAISQIFFVALTVSSIEDFRHENRKALIELSLESMANKINIVTRLGRNIQSYSNAKNLLADLKTHSQTADAFIIDTQGKIVHGKSTYGIFNIANNDFTGDVLTIKDADYKISKIFGVEGNVVGYILTSLETKSKDQGYDDYTYDLILKLIYASIVCAVICLCYFSYMQLNSAKEGKSVSRFKLFILPFIMAQLLVTAISTKEVIDIMHSYSDEASNSIVATIQKEFERVAKLGISLKEVSGIDSYLVRVKDKAKIIANIAILDEKQNVIAGQKDDKNLQLPIYSMNKNIYGFVEASINYSYLAFFGGKLALTVFTLLVISCLAFSELSSIVSFEIKRLAQNTPKILYESSFVRPLAFLGMFATFMPMSIVPIFMGMFVKDFPNMSKEVVMSLAVTTEMLAIGVTSLLLLIFKSRFKDCKKVLILGLSLISVGMLIGFASHHGIEFILSRAVYGLGYGCVIVGLQLFVVDITAPKDRAFGMSNFIAGLYAGILCGCAAGGLIADKLGYRVVFLSSFFVFVLALITLLFLMKNRMSPPKEPKKLTVNKLNFTKVIAFIKSREIASFMFLQVVPCSLITIGFFNYFLPVFINQNGFGATTVGQINFVYTIIIIVLSPMIGKVIDKAQGKSKFLALGLICTSLVPLLFSMDNPIVASLLGMSVLGIAMAINEGGQPAIISTYESSKIVGQEESIMILDIILRIGQVIGPMMVATLISSYGIGSFKYLSFTAIAFAVVFMTLEFLRKHQEPDNSKG